MKIISSDKKPLVDDLLLGGAALSLYDLAMVESQEIEWLLGQRNGNQLDIEPLAS